MPDYILNWTARSSTIQRGQRCQWCSSLPRRWPSQNRGAFRAQVCHWALATDAKQSAEKSLHEAAAEEFIIVLICHHNTVSWYLFIFVDIFVDIYLSLLISLYFCWYLCWYLFIFIYQSISVYFYLYFRCLHSDFFLDQLFFVFFK